MLVWLLVIHDHQIPKLQWRFDIWNNSGTFWSEIRLLMAQHDLSTSHWHRFKDTGHTWLFSKTSLLTLNMYIKYKTCDNLSSIGCRSWEITMKEKEKKRPCHTQLCAFRCLISRPQILNLRSRNQIRGKLLLSRKLCYFRGSRFSQCFILSTAPHYSLPNEVLCS